ncbi:hypothetical protein FRB90_004487 [Tulasnella sp. 427]|nr:hypothetical protein FRB90_004487 [Tulasnella sp. 427]
MAVVASAELIEKICVERDEQVGIYGFIFWRDSGWVDVVIDDYLCTKVPPWETLSGRERMLYHGSREKYNKSARRGSQNLLFARAASENETWVPLLEKAYAKLHGDYESLSGGFTAEGIEDLTGAVSTTIYLKDILDPDRFWKEELMRVGIDRVFACGTFGVGEDINSDGLVSGHAYGLLKAVEHEGRRFLVIRNPWGRTEWKGRWSDGSKEWNDEFAVGLKKALGDFKFGDDGEFVQEYEDFLQSWEDVDRNLLFDENWSVNSQWVGLYPANHITWSHGDVTFTISVAETTEATICLAQMDTRYFQELSGMYAYRLDFTLFKNGDTIPIGHSQGNQNGRRSVKMQTVLEAGDYVVQVRIGREKAREEPYDFSKFNEVKLARKRSDWATSKSIAINFDPSSTGHLPLPPGLFGGKTLLELQVDAQGQINAHREKQQARKKVNAEAREAVAKAKAEAEAKKAEEEAKANGEGEKEGEGEEKTEQAEQAGEKQEDEEAEKVKEPKAEESGEEARKKMNEKDQKRKGFFNRAMDVARQVSFSESPAAVEDEDGAKAGSVNAEEGKQDEEDAKDSDYNSEDAARDAASAADEEEDPEPHMFGCDECGEQIKGALHHCMESSCVYYTVCDDCKKFEDHPVDHTFVKFPTPEDAQAIMEDINDDGDGELVLGLRVYTERTVPATVKGQIRKGSILRKHYLKKK